MFTPRLNNGCVREPMALSNHCPGFTITPPPAGRLESSCKGTPIETVSGKAASARSLRPIECDGMASIADRAFSVSEILLRMDNRDASSRITFAFACNTPASFDFPTFFNASRVRTVVRQFSKVRLLIVICASSMARV